MPLNVISIFLVMHYLFLSNNSISSLLFFKYERTYLSFLYSTTFYISKLLKDIMSYIDLGSTECICIEMNIKPLLVPIAYSYGFELYLTKERVFTLYKCRISYFQSRFIDGISITHISYPQTRTLFSEYCWIAVIHLWVCLRSLMPFRLKVSTSYTFSLV
jgi:hypothetical protein